MAKRKYTFRKGQLVPYEAGSLAHQLAKGEKEGIKQLHKDMKKIKRI